MNRLLQHFVDSGGAQGAPAARPPIPAPPQSSGGSYHAGNRGSYHRTAPGGQFYYQPPPQPQMPHWQQHSEGHSGLDEIPLTSQSTGTMYETVDLNADSSQQHLSPQFQPQPQRLFTPSSTGHRLPSAPNSQGQNHNTPLFKAPTPPSSRDGYTQQKAPRSTGSVSELFASGPPPARELFGGPPSGGNGNNPYRRQSNSMNAPFAASPSGNGGMFGNNTTPPKDPFAGSPLNGLAFFGQTESQKDPFAASPTQNGAGQTPQSEPLAATRSDENRNVVGNGAGMNTQDLSAAQAPKGTAFQQEQQQPAIPTGNAFVPAPFHSGSSSFESSAPSDGGHQRVASADSLFSSSAPTNNGDWSHPAPSTLPAPPPPTSPAQAHELFASNAPSVSSLFGGDAPSPFQMSHLMPSQPTPNASLLPPKPEISRPPSPGKPPVNVLPSPAKSPTNVPSSPMMKPPVAAPLSPKITASSPLTRTQVSVPVSPVMRLEDHFSSSFGSMKLSTPAKSPLRSGLDIRHMKLPTGKRDDDAMSNAPSIAPSRISMLSTLDDSLKLSDMYKQMTSRLEGEKHDLLKVVASQAQEIAHMKKHIKSLELQLKKYRSQDA